MDFKLHDIENVLKITRIANVHFFEFPKDYETVDDKHPFCELIYVSSGTLGVRSDDFTGNLTKNHMIIHPSNSLHSLSCPNNVQTTVIIIGFECKNDKLNNFASKPVQLDEIQVKQLAEIVKEGRNVFTPPYDVPLYIMKKKRKQTFGSEQLLRSLLENFLISLIRKHEFFEQDDNSSYGFEIDQIIKYVDVNFAQKISIDELSFLFRTNRSTLCKEFKKATGKTLITYANDKKIEFLKTLLSQTNKTIQEISDTIGFTSVPNFYAFFKKHTGITPIDYKKNFVKLN